MAITKAPAETNAPPCSSVSPSCRINGASKGKIIEKQAPLARLPAIKILLLLFILLFKPFLKARLQSKEVAESYLWLCN